MQVTLYPQETKKYPQNQESSQTQSAAQTQNDVHGLTFGGYDWQGSNGKDQNTAVFNSLDQKAKDVIRQTINGELWCSPKKIAEALNKAGINAVTGQDSKATYIEITEADGSKYRIWDVGSDGGIGTQDIDFNNALASFKEEIKNVAATQNVAINNSTTAEVESKSVQENTEVKKAEVKTPEMATDKSNKLLDFFEEKALQVDKQASDEIKDKKLLDFIIELLRIQGRPEDKIEEEAKALLPYYKAIGY